MTTPSPTRRDPEGFDPDVENVVRHMIGCSPCRETMSLMSGEPDEAMQRLAAERTQKTVVQRVLSRRAAVGKRVVADLVYEMAKASLMADSHAARSVVCVRLPVSPGQAAQLVSDAASRSGLVLPVACLKAPPSPMEAVQVAEDVITTLQVLEGPSPRAVLLTSVIHNTLGRFDSAETVLRDLLRRDLDREYSKYARQQLSRSLIGQVRGTEALAVAQRGLAAYPGDATLTLNAILSTAQTGNDDLFQSLCKQFRELSRSQLTGEERRFAHTCVSILSSNLPIDEVAIGVQLGISRAEDVM